MFKGAVYFFRYCWKLQKCYLIFILLTELSESIVVLLGILFPKYILNELFEKQRIKYCIFYIGLFLGMTLLLGICNSYFKYFAEKNRDKMYQKFSILYAEQVMENDYEQFENPDFLDLREKALKCMTSNYGFAGTILLFSSLLGKIFLITNIIIIVSNLDSYIFLILIILILCNIYSTAKEQKKNIQLDLEATTEQRKVEYIKSIGEEVSFSKEIRLYNLCNWVVELYKNQFYILQDFLKKKNKNTYISMSIHNIINFLQQAVVYIYLIINVLINHLSIGSFTMYLNAVLSFRTSITEIFNILINLQQATLYFKPFMEFMELSKNSIHKKGKFPCNINNTDYYEIKFEGVFFRYPGQERWVLEDVSAKIHSGEKISIVGENGAGKTTFIKLLLGLYFPTIGKITLNGIDISNYKYEEYKKVFSVVFQDFKLFAVSIKENIAFSESDAVSNEEIMDILKKVGLSEKVSSLDKNLYTPIYKIFEEGGIELSGGEEQKVAMARAFYKNSSIIILDEPTAALDPRAECKIYQEFADLAKEKTAFFISHRLASCKMCDRVLVFKNGSIVESGRHSDLIQRNGEYAQLFQMQSKYYEESMGGESIV